MEIVTQLAAGSLCGLASGFAVGLFRLFAVVAAIAIAAFLAATLAMTGVPGVVAVLQQAGDRIINFAPFCVAYAAGSLIGRAAAAR